MRPEKFTANTRINMNAMNMREDHILANAPRSLMRLRFIPSVFILLCICAVLQYINAQKRPRCNFYTVGAGVVGATLGAAVVGATDGTTVGATEGAIVGATVGATEGATVGAGVGGVGALDGATVGSLVGSAVGATVGAIVGAPVIGFRAITRPESPIAKVMKRKIERAPITPHIVVFSTLGK